MNHFARSTRPRQSKCEYFSTVFHWKF